MDARHVHVTPDGHYQLAGAACPCDRPLIRTKTPTPVPADPAELAMQARLRDLQSRMPATWFGR